MASLVAEAVRVVALRWWFDTGGPPRPKRARRPKLKYRRMVFNDGSEWPQVTLSVGTAQALAPGNCHARRPRTGTLHWQSVLRCFVEYLQRSRSGWCGFAGFPAAAPAHAAREASRDAARTATWPRRSALSPGLSRSRQGIRRSFERACSKAGSPPSALGHACPHYVAGRCVSARASVALLDVSSSLTGSDRPPTSLAKLRRARARVDELIAQSSEHQEMVRPARASRSTKLEGRPGSCCDDRGVPSEGGDRSGARALPARPVTDTKPEVLR